MEVFYGLNLVFFRKCRFTWNGSMTVYFESSSIFIEKNQILIKNGIQSLAKIWIINFRSFERTKKEIEQENKLFRRGTYQFNLLHCLFRSAIFKMFTYNSICPLVIINIKQNLIKYFITCTTQCHQHNFYVIQNWRCALLIRKVVRHWLALVSNLHGNNNNNELKYPPSPPFIDCSPEWKGKSSNRKI